MGHYTELECKIKLRKDTPESVLEFLKRVLIEKDLGNIDVFFKSGDVFKPEFDHEFFKCQRWFMLFLSTNFGDVHGGKMYKDGTYWVIDLNTEFKNYDGEIDKFIDWISPLYVGRKKKKYVGWHWHEAADRETNIYIIK